jgi:hypothetical protein
MIPDFPGRETRADFSAGTGPQAIERTSDDDEEAVEEF